jgi:uncharacterized membrane protein (DUF485 family)
MESQRFCQDCIQKHDCKRIYEQLGDSSCESVTLKVILVFLLPLIVFIVSLAVFGRVLAGAINIEGLNIILSFVLALIVTFIYVYIIRVFNKQLGLNK